MPNLSIAALRVASAASTKFPQANPSLILIGPSTALHPWVKTWATSGGVGDVLFELSHGLAGFDFKAALNRLSTSHGAGEVAKVVPEHVAKYALNITASAMVFLHDQAYMA